MTIPIIVFTVLLSVAAFYNRELLYRLMFNPYMISARKQWYRFLSCGFIHADWIHLLINMLVLFWSGRIVEFYYAEVFNEKASFYFLLLYIGGIVISITPGYKRHMHNAGYNSLGASGAVSAVLFTAILFQPMEMIYLFGVLGLPGIVYGIAYLVYSYQMDKKGGDFINHDAHFWGAIYGLLFTILLKPAIVLHFLDEITSFLP